MRTTLALIAGVAIGAVAIQGLNAQTAKPRVFMISESQIVNKDALPAYQKELLPAIKAAGGTIHLSDRVVQVLGDAPQRVGLTEFDSVDKAQAWIKGPERAKLGPERDKAVKILRQYIVEMQ